MSNVKICWKGRVSKKFLLEFWEARGEKLMTCHLFLDNFPQNFVTFGLFSKVKSFWNRFVFQENLNIIILKLWILSFWTLSFTKDVLLQKFDCVFVLAIRGLLHVTKNLFCLVVWFCVLITVMESFLKSFLKEIMVLSKTCVSFRNRIFKRFEWIVIKSFLSHRMLGGGFIRHYGESLKTFPFWKLTFESSLLKGQICSR